MNTLITLTHIQTFLYILWLFHTEWFSTGKLIDHEHVYFSILVSLPLNALFFYCAMITQRTHIPYRNLKYKAQKFAMVLSSLEIHGINGLRRTLLFLGIGTGGSTDQA